MSSTTPDDKTDDTFLVDAIRSFIDDQEDEAPPLRGDGFTAGAPLCSMSRSQEGVSGHAVVGSDPSLGWSNMVAQQTMSTSRACNSIEALKDPRSFSHSSSISQTGRMASSLEGAAAVMGDGIDKSSSAMDTAVVGRNLFIANLSPDVNDDVFQEVFSPFGKILSAKVMLDIHSGRSRGFGFVMFADEASGREAYKKCHNTPIGAKGQLMQISKAQTSGESAITQTNKLYVRNVPRHVPELELREYFQQFGELKRFVRKEDTSTAPSPSQGKIDGPPGYVVFLEYGSHQEALVAVKGVHGKAPWTGMRVPMMAKTAETAEMRGVRKERQSKQRGVNGMPMNMGSTKGKMVAPPYPTQVPSYATMQGGMMMNNNQPTYSPYNPFNSPMSNNGTQNVYLPGSAPFQSPMQFQPTSPYQTQMQQPMQQMPPIQQMQSMQHSPNGYQFSTQQQQHAYNQPLYVVDPSGGVLPISAYGMHSGDFGVSGSMSYSFDQSAGRVSNGPTPPNTTVFPPPPQQQQQQQQHQQQHQQGVVPDSSLMVHMPPGMRPPGI